MFSCREGENKQKQNVTTCCIVYPCAATGAIGPDTTPLRRNRKDGGDDPFKNISVIKKASTGQTLGDGICITFCLWIHGLKGFRRDFNDIKLPNAKM